VSKATATTAPLDDVMLAMDVVDTLRHRQDLVARELDAETREKQLIAKLRDIYHQQGIEVPDSVLEEGVAALAESRFVYTPPKPSFQTFLARLYVSRKRWGSGAIAFLIVTVLGLGGYYLGYKPYVHAQEEAARIELAETMPAQMDALYKTIYEETKVQQAVVEADEIIRRGKTAASERNRAGATAAISELTHLRDQIRQRYTLQIVNRDGVKTGFWTFPEINTDATNYYLVVEALDPDGHALGLPIKNEESGVTETVALWGVRVPESVYRAVEADKRDDGIIQQNQLGAKEEGFLDVDYFVPGVTGAAVTRW
jgi:hypothetical protein